MQTIVSTVLFGMNRVEYKWKMSGKVDNKKGRRVAVRFSHTFLFKSASPQSTVGRRRDAERKNLLVSTISSI
jgi:hypothetical protein